MKKNFPSPKPHVCTVRTLKYMESVCVLADLEVRVEKDNFATFRDEKQNEWTLAFDSQDLLVNLLKQFLLCKTVFR